MSQDHERTDPAGEALIELSLDRLDALGSATTDAAALEAAVASIRERTGPGHEMLGWLDLPVRRDDELKRLHACAARLRKEIDVLVVVGIGGSYLGARAVLEAMEPALYGQELPIVLFAGHHLEASAYSRLLDALEGHEVAINVISKSGTTTEPALAFRLLRAKLEKMYGEKKAAQRIVATTDASRGALRTLATQKGYETFVVPDDVGGRFSVLTPVGLLPLAVAGVDVDALLDGAARERERCLRGSLPDVPAIRYAAARHDLYLQGAAIEVLASFHPSLHSLVEWWKQLFGESEGKAGCGLFPAAVDFTTDLHSLGQLLQDGRRNLLETFLDVRDTLPGPFIPKDPEDLDGLNYVAGRNMSEINGLALQAVADAHRSGGLPNMTITLPRVSEPCLGSLLFFFEFAVAIGGRLLGVNPFDQPGVEAYKTNLFRLLGKPGVG
jgi:glucose-6-phosphate isomerase